MTSVYCIIKILMPMFNHFSEERFPFVSNPSLPEKPKIVPEEKDGVVHNRVVYEPGDNKPLYGGVHYSAETMSLRAKLNLGINLQQVSIGQLENDPSVIQKNAIAFEQRVLSELDNLKSSVESNQSNEE